MLEIHSRAVLITSITDEWPLDVSHAYVACSEPAEKLTGTMWVVVDPAYTCHKTYARRGSTGHRIVRIPLGDTGDCCA